MIKASTPNIGNDGLPKHQHWANREAFNGKRVQYMEEQEWNIKQPPEYHNELILMEIDQSAFKELQRSSKYYYHQQGDA